MRRKLYLHIGFHKTGTSAIQEYLSGKRDLLAAQGIYYPESYDRRYPGHVDLSWALDGDRPWWSTVSEEDADNVLEYYSERMSATRCDSVILSSEDFSLLGYGGKAAITKVKDYFSRFDVQVVAYVREPAQFILSLYCHAVIEGLDLGDIGNYIDNHFDPKDADYVARLEPWRQVFGAESVRVRAYEPKQFKQGSLALDFFDLLGVDVALDGDAPRANAGVHPWIVEPYRKIVSSEMTENDKKARLEQLVEFSRSLPRVSAVDALLTDREKLILDVKFEDAKRSLETVYGVTFSR